MNAAFIPDDALRAWRRSIKKQRQYPESAIATGLVRWFAYAHKGFGLTSDHVLVHLKNEGKQSAIAGARMKAAGVRAGASDYVLFVPRNGAHGLCLELKASKGKLSDAQKSWLDLVTAQGYAARVAYSLNEAIETVTQYLRS